MNPMQNKTPEERREIAKKSHETRRRRSEDRKRLREEASERAHSLSDEIAQLEAKRDALLRYFQANEAAVRLAGHVLLSEACIVDAAKPWAKCSGVYFLTRGNRVVYVGQSTNVFHRVASHTSSKQFDSMAWVPCDPSSLDRLESLYIHVLKPELNANTGPAGSKSAPIGLSKLLGIGVVG